MDLGAAPRRSRHLAGPPPSTSPPPLGERNRQSRRTTSHIDSHMMGDREDGIPELSFPLRWMMGSLLLPMTLQLICL